MTSSNGAAAVFGSTGLVGSNILKTILATEAFTPVHTVTRRELNQTSPNLHAVVEKDNTKWAATLSAISPAPTAVFSAVGTTRAEAGGIDNQWKIDHDLQIELARAAKAAGVKTFVVISSALVRASFASGAPYSKMKIGVEDAVEAMGFEHAIVLRPGAILGSREKSRPADAAFQSLVRGLSIFSQSWQDKFGQEAPVIGRAAVRAAQLAEEGKAPGKFWALENDDIVRLGRDEWPGAEKTTESKPSGQ